MSRALHIVEPDEGGGQRETIRRVLAAFPAGARLYGRIRFRLIPPDFLDSLEQHLPSTGVILDLGCGFGMFALYFALRRPQCRVIGVDLDARRIAAAQAAARALGAGNVEFLSQDLASQPMTQRARAAYCIDLVHHLLPVAGERLMRVVHDNLEDGGVFVIKDLLTRPRVLMWWAYLHDRIMYPRDSLTYRSAAGWRAALAAAGFTGIRWYPIGRFSPYAHFIAIGERVRAV